MTTWGRFLFHSEDFVRDLSAYFMLKVGKKRLNLESEFFLCNF